MKIHIVVRETHSGTPFYWNPDHLPEGRLNGSEEMVVKLGSALARLGHRVLVANNLEGQNKTYNGVEYMARQYYEKYSVYNYGDALIAFRCPDMMQKGMFVSRHIWTSDPSSLTPAQRVRCDYLYGISPWHEAELRRINPGMVNISHIEPGFDPVIERRKNPWGKKKRMQCLYASSHDRGLKVLLDGYWPNISKSVPRGTLIVTYGGDDSVSERDGVYNIGRLTDKAMEELYYASDVLLYPCNGGERFCLTVLKAQYYGCIPVVIPTMALEDTVQFGVKTTKENFSSDAIKLLLDEDAKRNIRGELLQKLRFNSWDDVASIWEGILVGKGRSTQGS